MAIILKKVIGAIITAQLAEVEFNVSELGPLEPQMVHAFAPTQLPT